MHFRNEPRTIQALLTSLPSLVLQKKQTKKRDW